MREMALDVEEDEHDDKEDSRSEEEDSDYSAGDEETSDHDQAGPSGEQDWHNSFMYWDFDLLACQLILVGVVWQLQVAIQLTKLAFK